MRNTIIGCIICCLLSGTMYSSAQDMPADASHDDWMLLISPLAGWHENTLISKVPGPGGMMEVSSTDSAPEYNLFSLFVSPRVVVNNTFFYSSKPNDADITGDFVFVNLYGDPASKVRWNIGAGYLWHEIELDSMSIDITMPMAKLGFVATCPLTGLRLNPYLGYAWEGVETTHGNEYTDSIIYGLTIKYNWRMLHLSMKYYLQDNLDTNEQYNNAKVRASFFFNEQFGVVARGEYSEHSSTEDKSFLLGPAIIF